MSKKFFKEHTLVGSTCELTEVAKISFKTKFIHSKGTIVAVSKDELLYCIKWNDGGRPYQWSKEFIKIL